MALSHSRGKINSERSVVRRGGVTLSGGRLPMPVLMPVPVPVPVRGRKPAWQTRGQAGVQASEQANKRASNRPIERTGENESPARHTLRRGKHAIEFPPSIPRDAYVHVRVCVYIYMYMYIFMHVYTMLRNDSFARYYHLSKCH